MNRDYQKWYSDHLGKDMELLVHGHAGTPFIIFPCSNGRFFDFENRGMFHTVEQEIKEGKAIFFSVDSIDWETWHNHGTHPSVGAARHENYDQYIIHEVIPYIHQFLGNNEKIIAAGASMGAYHAVNFFLRHPDFFGGTLALSGNYHAKHFVGDYMDEHVYFNSPLAFLPGLQDNWYLDQYRSSKIFVCTGQGAWEETMVEDTHHLKSLLEEKNVPAHIEFWGHDVNHDWNWWELQFPYFVKKIV